MVVQSGSTKPLPTPIVGIEQKSWLFLDHPLSHHIPTQFFLTEYLGEYLPPF
jgi:hypothetical protein